jgi:hypothetical protein
MDTMKKIKDDDSAIDAFIEAATKHAEAIEKGDYKYGNKQCNIITRAIFFLKEHNALLRLEPLLYHDSIGVRKWSARYFLHVKESEGIKALKAISELKEIHGIHAMGAEITISEWEKGNLKL